MKKNRAVNKGFTLIELMITIAIGAIVLSFAIPSFKSMIISNRTATTANILVGALSYAKSEAVKSGLSVKLLKNGATTRVWTTGWIVFSDTDGDDVLDAGETLLKTFEAVPTGYTLTTGATFANSVTYLPTGLLSGGAGDTFKLCDPDKDVTKAREIILNTIGRVYTRTGTGAGTCP